MGYSTENASEGLDQFSDPPFGVSRLSASRRGDLVHFVGSAVPNFRAAEISPALKSPQNSPRRGKAQVEAMIAEPRGQARAVQGPSGGLDQDMQANQTSVDFL